MSRRLLWILIAAVLASYLGVGCSPLPSVIGRSRPGLAAALSPPLFNFHGYYTEGPVLWFRVGMSREELRKALLAQGGPAWLEPGCAGLRPSRQADLVPGFTFLRFTAAENICVFYLTRRLSLDFELEEDRVKLIEVHVIHNELI